MVIDLSSVFQEFKTIKSVEEKIKFIKNLETLGLSNNINYKNLVKAWEKKLK